MVSQDLLGIIRILKVEGWFTIEEYNFALENLELKGGQASDRPQRVPENSKAKRLVGKAISIWVHVRNWPFIMKNFVKDKNNKALVLGYMLQEIVERICSPQFRECDICILEEKIVAYIDLRTEVHLQNLHLLTRATPKTHFMTHYPHQISRFGPLINVWTARFESRHRLAKSTAESGN